MSKRTRDGPILLQNKRICNNATSVLGSKRQRDCFEADYVKRARVEPSEPSRKRTFDNDFDNEFEHLHKRMRASIPTAEQTIAFMLPFILNMRRLYMSSQLKVESTAQQCETLQQHLGTIQTAYLSMMTQNNNLKRELDIMRYRAMLRDRENPNSI